MKDITNALYNKYYKLILIIPVLMLLFSLGYLYSFNSATGDIIKKDVSLTGGTSVTVFDKSVDINLIKAELSKEFPDMIIRGISDIGTGGQKGFNIETKSSVETITASLEKVLGYKLTDQNSSIEFSGETLSQGFYKQIINSIIAAFLLMSWVVFLIFADSRKMKGYSTMLTFLGVVIALYEVSFLHALSIFAILFGAGYSLYKTNSKGKDYAFVLAGAAVFITLIFVAPYHILLLPIGAILVGIYIYSSIPSFAIILSAFADIAMTLTTVNLLDMSVSSAGIVAFLMLIGYSVDTDILLTTRLLKSREGSVNQRIWGAFKTGMSMVSTSIAAVAVSLIIIYNLSDTLRQIFTILLIGLVYDIFNTWITNTSMLKWYMEVKKIE